MWPMNRTETIVVLIFAGVFGGSLFCASEILDWGEIWSSLFAVAMAVVSMGVMYLWGEMRRTVYVSNLRPRSGNWMGFRAYSKDWSLDDDPNWFARRN